MVVVPIIFVVAFLLALSEATIITNDTSTLETSYEYIIVGGGTAGLAVANRLSVNHTVLVVERGPDAMNVEAVNDPFTPFGTPSPCHFQLNSPPQVGSNGTRIQTLIHGSCLGGGSSINAMMGSRPTFAGMSALEALGNPGWGWNDFLPFMQKSETFHPPNAEQRADGADYVRVVHGFEGPVGVSFAIPFVAPAMQNAAINTTEIVYGLSLSPDLGTGFSGGHVAHYYHHIHFNETIQADRRSLRRDHLVDIVTTKAESNGNITATGVTTLAFNARGNRHSAGALYSPGVLQRSGIGNATFLQSLGITPVLDLPGVGANFQDQILLTNVSFPLAPGANTTNVTAGANVLLGVTVAHPTATDAFGPNGGLNRLIQAALSNSSADFTLSVGGVVNEESFSTQASVMADAYRIDREHYIHSRSQLNSEHNMGHRPNNRALLYAWILRTEVWSQSVLPLSRGTVLINTTNPSADPVANNGTRHYSGGFDLPFSDLISSNALAESNVPGPDATDDEVRDWVLATYTPGVHFIGSNSMMPKELGGVVSPELLVYGTTNIRVADASVVPLSVFPHTTLGIYGVAEKGADMILKAATN
ncbi:hypothetical protein K438DRAFT_1908996 [Mycena galopus ATCC 62051]|nr:hypothetical protein K438DRAFT_1908996 [Mycena galopus ATCC 62051]